MTCKRTYQCDLCHGTLADAPDGIGIRWGSGDQINAVFFADSEHHLCNRCVAGLREMFADLDRTTQMYRNLDAAGKDDCPAAGGQATAECNHLWNFWSGNNGWHVCYFCGKTRPIPWPDSGKAPMEKP